MNKKKTRCWEYPVKRSNYAVSIVSQGVDSWVCFTEFFCWKLNTQLFYSVALRTDVADDAYTYHSYQWLVVMKAYGGVMKTTAVNGFLKRTWSNAHTYMEIDSTIPIVGPWSHPCTDKANT